MLAYLGAVPDGFSGKIIGEGKWTDGFGPRRAEKIVTGKHY
jgi:hypothetical protein